MAEAGQLGKEDLQARQAVRQQGQSVVVPPEPVEGHDRRPVPAEPAEPAEPAGLGGGLGDTRVAGR